MPLRRRTLGVSGVEISSALAASAAGKGQAEPGAASAADLADTPA